MISRATLLAAPGYVLGPGSKAIRGLGAARVDWQQAFYQLRQEGRITQAGKGKPFVLVSE
jgi:hypothetical protein